MNCAPINVRHIAALLIIPVALCGCAGESRPDAKATLRSFFAALHTSDTAKIAETVDLLSAARSVHTEFPQLIGSGDSAGDGAGAALQAALTGDGFLRRRWTEDQIVLGTESINGDTALVEVSFIDRVTRVQYYNKMRLEYRTDHWVITHFRTL
jgi:hypothetical protein